MTRIHTRAARFASLRPGYRNLPVEGSRAFRASGRAILNMSQRTAIALCLLIWAVGTLEYCGYTIASHANFHRFTTDAPVHADEGDDPFYSMEDDDGDAA